MRSVTEVASLLRQISACNRAIQEARDVAIAEARQTATCPRCGARVDTAAYQGFIESGIGLSERLIGRCLAGHEWAVKDPTFRWEEMP
jgi:hypothetical protein